jgi:transposase
VISPEQVARRSIDRLLAAAGWAVQDYRAADLTAARGVALREFALNPGYGTADYLLYVDGRAAGIVEAKKQGATLTGVEVQSGKYAQGLPASLPAHSRPLPFLYESTGLETHFTNTLDPDPRARNVFAFHRPETLADWLGMGAGEGVVPAKAGIQRLLSVSDRYSAEVSFEISPDLMDSSGAGRSFGPRRFARGLPGSGARVRAEAPVVRLGEAMKIVELHRQGLSVSAIARRTGADRKTVRKYIANGVAVPRYGPRTPRPGVIDPYLAYVTERVQRYPELSERRLLREIRELGYTGGRTALGDVLRAVRPPRRKPFEIRFETAAGVQAQVDFAHFKVVFDDEPSQPRALWLFSLVLGHSRYLWARFVAHQDLQTVLRMHVAAFADLGGVPREILYDRMKTAVLGEGEAREIVYNDKLIALAQHYGFAPRACRPYRAKTKGKVERPFRYIRQDFFLARRFANLEDLNRQLAHWLATVANVRVHGTTQRVIADSHCPIDSPDPIDFLLNVMEWRGLSRK